MKITEVNGKLLIDTPYNPNFVAKVKALGAKWNAAEKVWTADANAIEHVRQAMLEIYGEADIPTESDSKVNVRVTAINNLYGEQAPIVLFGKIVASARGRDSGAKIGEKVAFIDGKPESAGSAKNWTTRIARDTVFEMYEVNEILVNNENPDIKIEIIPGKAQVNRDALVAEKEKLLARLAEIEKLINE